MHAIREINFIALLKTSNIVAYTAIFSGRKRMIVFDPDANSFRMMLLTLYLLPK